VTNKTRTIGGGFFDKKERNNSEGRTLGKTSRLLGAWRRQNVKFERIGKEGCKCMGGWFSSNALEHNKGKGERRVGRKKAIRNTGSKVSETSATTG